MRALALAVVTMACRHPIAPPPMDGAPAPQAPLGAHWEPEGDAVSFRVASTRATRVELWIYPAPTGAEQARVAMTRAGDVWSARVAAQDLPPTIYYGYRAWG